jgi:transposase
LADATHVVLPKIGRVTVMSDDSLHPAMARSRSRSRPGQARHMGNRRRAKLLWRQLQRHSDSRIVRGTLSRGADGLWWLSLTAEVPVEARERPSRMQREGGTIGVDFGVRELATISNGVRIPNPRFLGEALDELKTAQRALSRATPGSNRYAKAKARVGLIHADVARLRDAALHRATTTLVRQHDLIAVEGWDVQLVLHRGSKGVPRRLRRDRNRKLADTGIGMARQMLTYKGKRLAATVMATSPQAPTGRTCSVCRTPRTTALPPHHEQFTSDQCGHVLDRRLNTARALAGWAVQEIKRAPSPGGASEPRGGDVRPGAGRKGRWRAVPGEASSQRPGVAGVRLAPLARKDQASPTTPNSTVDAPAGSTQAPKYPAQAREGDGLPLSRRGRTRLRPAPGASRGDGQALNGSPVVSRPGAPGRRGARGRSQARGGVG